MGTNLEKFPRQAKSRLAPIALRTTTSFRFASHPSTERTPLHRHLSLLLLCAACASSSNPSNGTNGDTDTPQVAAANECQQWHTAHPDWLFCDDFESATPMVAEGRYFEHGDSDGDFVPLADIGLHESNGMLARWHAGDVSVGGLKLAFGRNPNTYMKSTIRNDEDFREIFYRMYLKHQPGWQGNPAKLSRATVFASEADWSQAMIAHLWSDDSGHLLVDPASCVSGDKVICQGYNDFDNLRWLGFRPGTTPIFSTEDSGNWRCVEAHVRLNDPGQANGVHEFWIDGQLETRRDGLDFVGTYTDYAINAVFFENYWNGGSPVDQERYFDNIVVSTQAIGCN